MLLVTGITGHTGRYFLQQLVSNRYQGRVRCVVRPTSNIRCLCQSGLDLEVVTGDLSDVNFIASIMKDVEVVLHIYNVHHSVNIVQSAIVNNVSRVILVHTAAVYSKYKLASMEYMRIENELLEMAAGKVTLTILRPSMIYGDMCDHNMSKFVKILDKVKFLPLVDGGKGLIQPVNARDLGKAYYDVLMSNPQITGNKQYELTGDRPISLRESLLIISTFLNKKVVFISVPMYLGLAFAYFLRTITFGKLNFVEKVLRLGEDRAYSHQAAKCDFNFTPMPFESGIKIEVNEYIQLISKSKS